MAAAASTPRSKRSAPCPPTGTGFRAGGMVATARRLSCSRRDFRENHLGAMPSLIASAAWSHAIR